MVPCRRRSHTCRTTISGITLRLTDSFLYSQTQLTTVDRILNANIISDPTSATPLSTTDRQVPYVMYTDPQLGHIGLHEHEARAKFGDQVQVAVSSDG